MPSAADRRVFWLAAVGVVVVDFVTKLVAERWLFQTRGVPVVGDWFQLRLVYNQGAAFGLHLGPYSRWIFLTIAVVAVVALERWSRHTPAGDRVRQLILGLVLGGATGNLIDRIRSPLGVVDFLDIGIGPHRWPTFNVADMAISCGAIALALSLWREDARREEEERRAAAAATPHPAGLRSED